MSENHDAGTKKSIIDASLSLFARRGYHGTSIAQIAEATGLTKGALYWYFKGGKEELFLTVLDTIKEKWHGAVMDKMESVGGAAEKLAQFFDATAEMVAADSNPYSMHLFLISAGAQPEMKEFEEAIRAAYAGYVKMIADTIRSGQEDGEIARDLDAEAIAVGLIGCLEGIVLQARLHSPATVAAATAEMKRQFFRSLCMTPVRPQKKEKIHTLSADQLHLF
ncbi:MAG: TetR/AcrR family transcriptional regulator [Candidatus Abyssobacteria bacterium SURF_5]|uniref:TetR/AcrR family transcriptional regulator n=1 Tax=Abyssobacteria bacterium (strain SURF_5) TaxID=2093360 RepID=A0A3A4NUL3_ABYX5|nr:MAG: TetR/AcrR family transcriptional regulator [Candidatus Abyssubacteria bacterium SURF_5]